MTAALPRLLKTASAGRPCAFLALAGVASFLVGTANAQTQESRMDSILRPNRNQTSSFADKSFASSATVGGKQARTRTFGFSHPAVLRAGDGSFHAQSFTDRGKFQTGSFATKADRVNGGDAFTLQDRGFATKSMAVREAPAAGKAAPGVRDYLPADKSIEIRGKRQGDLDDLYHQKALSIDQVREILNKPGSGMDAPTQKIGPAVVLPAQPVAAPAAR